MLNRTFDESLRKTNTLAPLAAVLLLLVHSSYAQSGSHLSETVVTDEMCSGLFTMPLEWKSKDGQEHQLLAVFDTGASSAFIDPDSVERISGTRLEAGTRAVMQNVRVAGLDFSKFRPKVRELEKGVRVLFENYSDPLLHFRSSAYLNVTDRIMYSPTISRIPG
jgi:hypothetical protein